MNAPAIIPTDTLPTLIDKATRALLCKRLAGNLEHGHSTPPKRPPDAEAPGAVREEKPGCSAPARLGFGRGEAWPRAAQWVIMTRPAYPEARREACQPSPASR